MKSNLEIFSMATTLDKNFIAGIVDRCSQKDKKTFSSLALHYRKAIKFNKGVKKASARILDHIYINSQVLVISPRNKNSEISVNMMSLDDNGMKNLKLVAYLLREHYFLASNALALIGGAINVQSFQVTFNARFRTKERFLNEVSYKDAYARVKEFLKFNSRRCAEDLQNLKTIMEEIEV